MVRPGSNVTIRTMWERPSGPVTSAWNRPSSVGTSRMTGSVGSVRATCSSACVCMSITPGSSAGLPIFSTNPRAVVRHELDVLVPLADERRPGGIHTEDVRRHPLRVGGAERGRGRIERIELARNARHLCGGVGHGSTTLDNGAVFSRARPRAGVATAAQDDAEAARFSSYIVAVASSIAR